MSSLEVALRRLCIELVDARLRFALIGGLAVSVRTVPRFTRDVDIAVALDEDAEAEALVHDLRLKGYSVLALIEQDAVSRLATVRLQPPKESGGGLVLDLLFASSGIEYEIVESAETLEVVPGLTIPVALTGHLIALKVLSRDDRTRPQDVSDLRALLARATPEELTRAREALRLIQSRGFHRGRELMAMLDALIAEDD